jgi:hypothetical protein
MNVPELGSVALTSPEWLSREQHIRQVLASGKRHRDHRQYGADLRPESWDTDTSELRRSVDKLGGRWWRFLSPRWRRAKTTLATLCASEPPLGRASQLALLDAIAELAQCAGLIAGFGESMVRLFGTSGEGSGCDWDLHEKQADWVIGAQWGVHEGQLAPWCLEPARIEVDRAIASVRIDELDRARRAYRLAWIFAANFR